MRNICEKGGVDVKRINNRYHVLESTGWSRDLVSYQAVDTWQKDRIFELTLFSEDAMPRRLMQFFKEDYLPMTYLSPTYIRRVDGFSRLTGVDGMKRTGKVFFFTEESLEGREWLMAFQKGKSFWEKVRLFFDLLEAIYYLHLNGYVYGSVKPENIYIENGRPKLKSLVDITMASQGVRLEHVLQEKNDMVDAIHVFEQMLLEGEKAKTLHARALSARYGLPKKVSENLIDVLKKGKQKPDGSAFDGLLEFAQALQEALGTVRSLVNVRELEKLNFSTPLVGRQEALGKVMVEYEKMKTYEKSKKIFLINGNTGTGKTRFLEELYFLFSLKEDSVYESTITDKGEIGNNGMWQMLLRSVTCGRDRYVAEKYLSLVADSETSMPKEGLPESQDVLRTMMDYSVIERVSTFIRNGNMGNPIFLVDNFDNADATTLDAVSLFCKNLNFCGNAMLILSYNDYKMLDEDVRTFLEKIKKSPLCEDIELRPFTETETGTYIKNTLSMPDVPKVMTRRICEGGYSSPLFVSEILKKLHQSGKIFRNPEDGRWMITVKDTDMPETAKDFYRKVSA